MAYQEISTGYKPEFTLGGLYHGFNAANAEDLSKEELIKQFLANQHSQVQNPLDEQTTAQNLLANHYKTSPDYQTGMRDTISGQGMSNMAAGTTAKNLQQFKEKAQQAEFESQAAQQGLFANMYKGLGTQYDQSVPVDQRIASGEQSIGLANTLAEIDPTYIQKKNLLDFRGDDALELQDRRNAGIKERGEKERADPKYKEQLAQAFRTMANPNASKQEIYEAELFIYLDRQSRLASNPGAYAEGVDLSKLSGGKIPVRPAPVTQQPRPQAPGAVSDDELMDKYK